MKPESSNDVLIEDEADDAAALASSAAVVIEDEAGNERDQAELPARATLNDDGSVTLKLTKPISLRIKAAGKEREESYAELVFHELTGLDLRLAAQETDEMKRTIVTLARATRLSVARMNVVFDRLSQRDVKGATEVVEYFQG